MKKHRPWTCKIWTSGLSRGLLRFLETTQVQQHTMYCSLIPSGTTHCICFHVHCSRTLCEPHWWKLVIQFSRYASVDTTNVLSGYFMTVDMHGSAFMWLVYSRNKFFRVSPNISEKFVPKGTNFRGVQIKCVTPCNIQTWNHLDLKSGVKCRMWQGKYQWRSRLQYKQ